MLFSAFILPLAFASTTAEVSVWTDADYRTNRVVTLVGQVLATNGADVFLEDESGRIRFFANTPLHLANSSGRTASAPIQAHASDSSSPAVSCALAPHRSTPHVRSQSPKS